MRSLGGELNRLAMGDKINRLILLGTIHCMKPCPVDDLAEIVEEAHLMRRQDIIFNLMRLEDHGLIIREKGMLTVAVDQHGNEAALRSSDVLSTALDLYKKRLKERRKAIEDEERRRDT